MRGNKVENKITHEVYIGQTIHFIDRHKQHYSGNEEKFNTADFNQVIVIFSKYFNRSALDDVESQLITYFSADNSKTSKRTVEFDSDEVIDVVNLKVPMELSCSFGVEDGVYPAYHMNKLHWVSVLLPDAPEDVVRFLVSVSFELTEQKKTRVKNK